MKRFRRLLHAASLAVILLLTVGILACAAILFIAHRRQIIVLSVQSNSMRPRFRQGDAVIVAQNVGPQVGDVISYHSVKHPGQVVTHRLVAIAGRRFTTRGDGLRYDDVPFDRQQVIGVVLRPLPKAGYVIDFLRRPLGMVIAVYTPALCLIIGEVRRLSHSYRRPAYTISARTRAY